MKRITTLILFFSMFFSTTFSQQTISDSVSLGSGYANMSFYSMANGEQADVSIADWDIQIMTDVRSASVRTNDAAGVELYNLTNSDTSNWSSVDTTGMTVIYNSDTSWDIGAFNVGGDNVTTYGWGTYNQTTHNVYGDKIFVIKLTDGSFKKIWIPGLLFNPMTNKQFYILTYGNLDNSGEVTDTVYKTDYPTKTSVYYSLINGTPIDSEPAKTGWDLVFRRYMGLIAPGTYYPVTGALSNPNVTTAEAWNANVNTITDAGLTYSSEISTIGSDWKNFNMNTFMWELEDSVAYFVAAQNGYIYRLVFTEYGGSATGKIYFDKTQLEQQATAIEETSNIQNAALYPNPVVNDFSALFVLKKASDVTVAIYDLTGKLQSQDNYSGNSGLNKITMDTDNLAKGYYLMSIEDGASNLTLKFVKTE